MGIRKKVLAGVSLAAVAVIAAAAGKFLIAPALEIRSLEKLTPEDSPTAGYAGLMPGTEEIYGWAKDLTAMGARKPGTDEGRQAQQYVVEQFEEMGLSDIDVVKSNTLLWQCDDWGLAVGEEKIPCYYMTHSFYSGENGAFSTGADGIKAEIVYVGVGDESDFDKVDVEGKIVVADVEFTSVPVALAKVVANFFYDPDKTFSIMDSKINPYSANTYPYNYYYAMEHGAVGFVGILSTYYDSNEYNNEDYSYMEGNMEIPGLWVTKKDGEAIRAAIEAGGGTAQAAMTMNGSVEEVEAGAVIGFLPGRSDETLMVHSHYDSATTGAVEDASGTSAVLALAKFYSQVPQEQRGRTLMFVEMDTHFSDYDSHDAVIEKYLGEGHQVLADVCIEHLGMEYEEKNGELVPTGKTELNIVFMDQLDGLLQITKEEMVRHGIARTVIFPATLFGDEVPTDADMFHNEGVPIISMVSAPLYLYDNDDTVDKIAKEELKPVAEAFTDIVWRLMEADTSIFSE